MEGRIVDAHVHVWSSSARNTACKERQWRPVQMKDPEGDYEASVRLIRDRAELLSPRQGTDPRWHSVQLLL